MEEVNLKLSVNEVNTIIKSLGNLPYNQVYTLIMRIHSQASAQVNTETTKMNSEQELQESNM